MEDYPSNSKSRTARRADPRGEVQQRSGERKEIKRVVEGGVTRRKASLGKRFRETFFGGEDAVSVWQFVVMDVLVPATKDMVADALIQSVERTIFPDRGVSGRSSARRRTGHTDYNRQFGGGGLMNTNRRDPRERDDHRSSGRQARRVHDFSEIVVEKRVEAEEVLDMLDGLIETYREASVADLYEMVGLDSTWADQKWGWTNLRGARVVRTREGYLIDLPKPEPLD